MLRRFLGSSSMPGMLSLATVATLAGLTGLLPEAAAAECLCTCMRGRPIAVCNPPAMVEPICQQLCTDPVDQTLSGGGLGGGGIGSVDPNGLPTASGTGTTPNAAALKALLGVR